MAGIRHHRKGLRDKAHDQLGDEQRSRQPERRDEPTAVPPRRWYRMIVHACDATGVPLPTLAADLPVDLPPTVLAAVLGSAVIHAGWNAAAKAIGQRLVASALMGAGYLIFGGLWCFLTPLPAAASWPYLGTSAILQTGYLLLLTAAYANGEFRQVYPLARGTAPVLVTAFSLIFLAEHLAVWQLVGIALVVGALGALVGASGRPAGGGTAPIGVLLAVATGVVIASYSLVDGLGVRQSGSAAGYAAWLMMLQGPLLIAVCVGLAGDGRAGDRRAGGGYVLADAIRRGGARTVALGLVGGLASIAAYAIVLWAQDRASLAVVSALRETSVLFAGVIGALFFAERLSPRQLVAAAGVVAGIALIQLG